MLKVPEDGGVDDEAYACTGGREDDRMQCFDLRFMWRLVSFLFLDMFVLKSHGSANGIGELYSYLPLTSHNAEVLANVPPKTVESSNYGFSVGRGAWTFRRGAWNTIAERISLNDPGKSNGKYC
jgi:hypothetical protein